MNQKTTLTSAAGCPLANSQNTITTGSRGPVLMQDVHLLEKMTHFNRELAPERVMHAKSAGTYGRFTAKAPLGGVPEPVESTSNPEIIPLPSPLGLAEHEAQDARHHMNP